MTKRVIARILKFIVFAPCTLMMGIMVGLNELLRGDWFFLLYDWIEDQLKEKI
jgi:hypothetical protein